MLTLRQKWPLVGREPLLQHIRATLGSPSATVVLLCGPSGVGKTRLAAEAADLLAENDWLIIPIAANEASSAIPLAALAPAFAVSRLDITSGDAVTVFEQATAALDAAAGGRRVLLVIDDLPRLDSLSLVVVTQLLSAGVVRLVATVRSGDPVPDPILSLWTSDSAVRIEVPPLTIEEYEAVLGDVLGGPVTNRTAADLHRMSGGNPLYLRELVLGAIESGQLVEHSEVWQLVGKPLGTPALHELIRARLRGLDADSVAIVEQLAVCQPLTLDDLASPNARSLVVALERAGLVTVQESGTALYLALAHPQYVEAVRGSLSRLRTIDILLTTADSVSSAGLAVEDELRVATWRLDAGQPSDPALLARAARLAVIAEDHEAAARLSAAALHAGAPAAEMLLLQGEALWTLGRDDQAVPLLDRAFVEDESAPTSPELTGRIATARAGAYWGDGRGEAAALERLDEVQQRNPELAATLSMPRALLLMYADEVDAALIELRRARTDPRLTDQSRAQLGLYLSHLLSVSGDAPGSLAEAHSGVAYATAHPSAELPTRWARMVLATVLLQAGEPGSARSMAITSLHDGMSHRDEVVVSYNEFTLAHSYLAQGKLSAAARWYRDVASGALSTGPIAYRPQAIALLAVTLAWQGQLDAARALQQQLEPNFVASHSYGALATHWIEAVTGNRDAATGALIERANAVATQGHRLNAATLFFAAARLGAADAAAAPLAALAESSSSDYLNAMAAHTAAEAAGDVSGLDAVGAQWHRSGHLLFAAEALASGANHAARAGRGREATALRTRADQLIAACEGAATPLLQFETALDPLTNREREIAALASQGLSSIEIATRLFLSPRTVNNHLQAVYGKLGIRGRSELPGT